MNSQFRNSNFGFILYMAIIAVMVMATGFVLWYMTVGYRVGTFGPDTRLGSVYIGGLTEEEVIPLIDERIDYWYNDETIVFELTYQGYRYEFDRSLLIFNLETSTYDLQNGVTNVLLVNYQYEDRQRVIDEIEALPFLEDVIDNVDIGQLIANMLYDAALMKSYSSKDVENYIIDLEQEIELLDSATFSIPEGVQFDDLIDEINAQYEDGKILIPGKSLFDVVDTLGGRLNDAGMTTLASAMLQTIHETNFIVNEVHYEPTIDFSRYTIANFPYFGRNTIVNRIVNESFSFYNPNELTYYFTIDVIDEFNGRLNLYGVPFKYDIEVTVDQVEIDYITQPTNDVTLLQNGYNGVVVSVQRVITDVYGEVVYDETILFEFYPPIKEITFEP